MVLNHLLGGVLFDAAAEKLSVYDNKVSITI